MNTTFSSVMLVRTMWSCGSWECENSILNFQLRYSTLLLFDLLRYVSDIPRVRGLIVQKKFEFLSVRAFLEVSDELGLPIGAMPYSPIASVPISYDPLGIEDERNPFEPIVALAQHHGCPTRLLDWTQSPETAAFFAAERAEDDGGELAVWA